MYSGKILCELILVAAIAGASFIGGANYAKAAQNWRGKSFPIIGVLAFSIPMFYVLVQVVKSPLS